MFPNATLLWKAKNTGAVVPVNFEYEMNDISSRKDGYLTS